MKQLLVVLDKMPDAGSINEDFVVGRVMEVSPLAVNQNLLHNAGLVSKQQIVKVKILEADEKGRLRLSMKALLDRPAQDQDRG